MTAANATAIEWFLGREGTQYGPLNDVEMRKLFELGHLRADDLVWRQGFAAWLPAPEVFKAPPTPASPTPPAAQPAEPAAVPDGHPVAAAGPQVGEEPAAAASATTVAVAPQDADHGRAAAFDTAGAAATGRQTDGAGRAAAEAPAAAGEPQPHAPAMTSRAEAHPQRHAHGQPPHGQPPYDQPARAQPGPTAAAPTRSHLQNPGRPQAHTPVFEPNSGPAVAMASGQVPTAQPASWSGPAAGDRVDGFAARSQRRPHGADQAGQELAWADPRGLPSTPEDLLAPAAPTDAPRRRPKPAKAARSGQKSTRRIAATLVVTAFLAAAGIGGYLYRDALADVAGRAGQQVAALMGRGQEAGGQQRPAARPPPSREPSGLWQAVKAEFPEWYTERTREAAKIRVETKDDRAAGRFMTEALVALRRNHADAALAASPESIRKMASTFVANLDELKRASVDLCYAYISLGEANPKILELADVKSATATIEAQIGAVFEAIAEGRRQPQTHLPPRKADYDTLADELVRRGWSDADLQLFSDPRQLARATPARVCTMVREWFAAHLAIQDPNVQLRLLIESLKPVVAG